MSVHRAEIISLQQQTEQTSFPAPGFDEPQRLAALKRYGILDTPPEPAYDDITRLVAYICQTPIALVTFIDGRRQWFKSEVGLGVRETPLNMSLCAHAMLDNDLFVIHDAARDERFRDNPLVTGPPHVRFYAGAVLEGIEGHRLGALCVLDFQPRDLTADQREALRALARQVMAHLELRRAESEARQAGAGLAAMLESALDCIVGMDHEGRVTVWNAAAERTFGYTREEAVGKEMASLIIPHRYRDAHRTGLGKYLATGEGPVLGRRLELSAVRKSGEEFPVELAITRILGDGPPLFTGQIRELTEQRRAEEARRKTEFRFQRLVEHSPQSTQLFHADGRTRQVNRAFERLFGITLDELHDYNILQDQELVRRGVMPLMQRAFAGEAVTIEPIPYVPDLGQYAGQTRWVGAYVYPVKDDKGRIEEVVLVHNDVTEQRKAQAALRESEERYRALSDSTADAVVMHDAGQVIEINHSAEVMFGYASAELLGRNVIELLVAPKSREAVLGHIRSGSEEAYEATLLRKDGTPVEVEIRGKNAEYRGRQVRVTSCYDVTTRLAAEAALRASEERFRQLADAMPQMVWVTQPDGYHEYYNKRWYEFTGAPEGSTDGEGWNGMFHPGDQGRAWTVWRHSLATGEPYEIEYRLRHHSGEYRWTLGRALPIRGAAGEITKWFGTCTDIHAIKQLQQEREHLLESERNARAEAERASQLKDEFLATVSHELRTPLNAILGYAQLLRHGCVDEDVAEGLEVIERNARSQTQIIEDLLDMSRVITGKLRLDVQQVELPNVIDTAMESVRPAADAKGIKLVRTVDPVAGLVSGDPSRLQQVIWNLLTNAVKFTPRGGRVQVVLARVVSHVELSVSDTGQGIRADFLPYVFDKFRQSDASASRRHGGLGLGLSLVKSLVELHGGKVRVSSPGEKMGATFTVELPLTAMHAEPADTTRRHPRTPSGGMPCEDGPSLEGLTVLAVDDEQDSRNLVRRVLEECGARVLTAASAMEALDLLSRERVDVVVNDIGMPDVDGYELVRRIRSLPPDKGGDVPAAALTAFARSEDRTRALIAGYQTHISKPVEPVELAAAVASLAQRSRRR